MAERRKNRKRKENEAVVSDDKPSKEEYAVAKYLREKLPEKKTSLLGHKVDYFISSKAIDCLLDSPWASKSKKHDLLFTTRDSIVFFMDRMLQHKFFHRARKIIVQKDPKKKKESEEASPQTGKDKAKEKPKVKPKEEVKAKGAEANKPKAAETSKEKHKDKKEVNEEEEKATKKTKSKDETAADDNPKEKEKCKEKEAAEKKKEKKKLKLDMHMEQLFLDGSEVYVWIYDPIPVRTWIIGMLMVIGAVLVCLFPLWPQVIRHYIYYVSVAAALFLVFIIGLAILRLIVFVMIWALTFGKHHLWLLPNLTADVGFFESFWPLYEYEYKGVKKEDEKSAKEENGSGAEKSDESSSDQEKKEDHVEQQSESEGGDSEEDEDKAKTDNGDNGFEILEKNEVEEEEKEKSKEE